MLGKSNGLSAKSGSDDIKPVSGIKQVRQTFEKALVIKPTDVKPETVIKTRKKIGEVKAYNVTLAELADAQKELQKELIKTHKTTTEYAATAAQNELTYQTQHNEAVQKIAPIMMKIDGEKAEQIGFNSYLPQGEKMLKY